MVGKKSDTDRERNNRICYDQIKKEAGQKNIHSSGQAPAHAGERGTSAHRVMKKVGGEQRKGKSLSVWGTEQKKQNSLCPRTIKEGESTSLRQKKTGTVCPETC